MLGTLLGIVTCCVPVGRTIFVECRRRWSPRSSIIREVTRRRWSQRSAVVTRETPNIEEIMDPDLQMLDYPEEDTKQHIAKPFRTGHESEPVLGTWSYQTSPVTLGEPDKPMSSAMRMPSEQKSSPSPTLSVNLAVKLAKARQNASKNPMPDSPLDYDDLYRSASLNISKPQPVAVRTSASEPTMRGNQSI